MRPRPSLRAASAISFALASVTCIPNFGSDDSTLASHRVLAIRAVPAEAVPGTKVTFTAFVAGPTGALPEEPLVWDFCTAPLPLTEDDVVSNACLGSSSLVAAGSGPVVTTATPRTGCSLFGPETPSAGAFRPTDPDATGGYYQPLRADLAGGAAAFALARISCGLAGANAEAASAFAASYRPNNNPTLDPLTATISGTPLGSEKIPAEATVTLVASWPPAVAETYAYFDPASQTVTTQREAMQVAWYSTGGALTTEATGRASTDPATTSTNSWTAPATAGPVSLFVVLRDSRGGVDFTTIAFTVVE
jgi:hypothetical protein